MLLCPRSPHITPHSSDNKGWIFVERSTGAIFRSHSLDALQGMVDKHRFAVAGKDIAVDLADGWQARWLNDVCEQNPSAPSTPNTQAEGYISPYIAQGRALWAELHAKAEQGNEPYALREWLDRWIDKIPDTSGCKCRSNAVQALNQNPPDFGPGFKAWAISFHNFINRKLGKRQWPYETTPAEVPPS